MAERRIPPDDILPAEFFTRWIPEVVSADESRRQRLGETQAILEFVLLGEDGGHYHLELVEGAVRGRVGPAPSPDLQIRLDVETWRALNRGALSAPEAFLRRRVTLSGNLALAVKLHLIIG